MKWFIFFFFVMMTTSVFSQTIQHTWQEEKKFGDYLFQNHLYNDCILLFSQQQKNNFSLSQLQTDSASFIIAKSFEELGKRDSMTNYFEKISLQSSFYNHAAFHSSLFFSEAGNYDKANLKLQNVKEATDTLQELATFNRASIALLKRDTANFNLLSKKFSFEKNLFEQEENSLMKNSKAISSARKKSPLLAGILSAAVPGLGKIYAGKPKQGLTAILPIAILAVEAYEGYNKGGITSGRFIFYSGLFSLFYIGNIWGSVLSVGVKKQEINNEINHQILSDMRLTVNRVFE